jgi:putative sterol carrier protein
MMATFPTSEWIQAINEKLNTDEQYARIAHKWEGDIRFILEPDDTFQQTMWLYFDLWHGKCRNAYIEDQSSTTDPAFVLSAPYGNFVKILTGEAGPMQALMTRMISVKGSMAVFMRNVPTVLNFVRCCQEVTDGRI